MFGQTNKAKYYKACGKRITLILVYSVALVASACFIFVVYNSKPVLPLVYMGDPLKSLQFKRFCDHLVSGNATEEERFAAKFWYFKQKTDMHLSQINNSQIRCEEIIAEYNFSTTPLSDEERDYPLAYGILVYKNAHQVYHMLSAFYHPQNVYCIAVSGQATKYFRRAMDVLEYCLPNVTVKGVAPVMYGGFTVLTGVFECVKILANSTIKWNYYQYLAGVDLPLKTNHEMVRIFKRLNNSPNIELEEYETSRLNIRVNQPVPYGMRLFKSSLSATFSRHTAVFLAHSKRAMRLLEFLNGTIIPDESFWGTMLANNYSENPAPGAFNGTHFLKVINEREGRRGRKRRIILPTEKKFDYYISRYQDWDYGNHGGCNGKYVNASCVFGIADIPHLLVRPQLVAHKLYMEFEPAAFFCLKQQVRERALKRNIENFDDTPYGDLPGPRITRGEEIETWFDQFYNA